MFLLLMSIKYMYQKDLCFKADENICSIWQITCFKAILVQATFSPFNMFPPDIWRELLSGQLEKDEFHDLHFFLLKQLLFIELNTISFTAIIFKEKFGLSERFPMFDVYLEMTLSHRLF